MSPGRLSGFDLAAVSCVDSAGLGEFVRRDAATGSQGGTLRRLHAGERMRHLLSITKLTTVFDVVDDESRAVTIAWRGRVATTA